MEDFYTPQIGRFPNMRQMLLNPQQRNRSPVYQFRQPQTQVNPLALRRLQLQEVESQRREEIAAGRQELEAIQQMAHLEQQEYKIRQEIAVARDVASAQREIAKLDPVHDSNYIQSYADTMSKHPLAKADRFLNEAFTHGASVFQSVQKAKLDDASEEFRTKQHVSEVEAKDHLKLIGEATANGIDVETYRTDSGEYDFNKIRSTVAGQIAKSQKSIDGVMATLPVHSVVVGSDGKKRATYEAAKVVPDVVTTTTKPGVLPDDPPVTTTSTRHVVPPVTPVTPTPDVPVAAPAPIKLKFDNGQLVPIQ